MFTKLTVSFTPEEREVLQQLAEADLRSPKDLLRWLLRQEAQRRGFLSAEGHNAAHKIQEERGAQNNAHKK
jgi:hypothetical protein